MQLNYEYCPITERNTLLKDWDSSVNQFMSLCMETGYHTFGSWHKDSEEVGRLLSYSAEYLIDSVLVKNDQIWSKIVIQTPTAVIWPDLDEDGNHCWFVNSFREMLESEDIEEFKVAYENQGKTMVLDDSTISVFGETEFESAFVEFHKRISEARNEN